MLIASPALAKMIAQPVSWTLNGTRFKNVLVYDDASQARRPGLVMVPNWSGIHAIAIEKAKRIACKAYVILLTDMYGEGVSHTNAKAAQAAVKPLVPDPHHKRDRIRQAVAHPERP